jgi:hypothetical protein
MRVTLRLIYFKNSTNCVYFSKFCFNKSYKFPQEVIYSAGEKNSSFYTARQPVNRILCQLDSVHSVISCLKMFIFYFIQYRPVITSSLPHTPVSTGTDIIGEYESAAATDSL